MQEKDKSQQGQELLDVDEKGQIEAKKIVAKPEKSKETYSHVLLIFLALVFFSKFLFSIKMSQSTTYTIN